MPQPIPADETRTVEQLEAHYRIERELADRLRRADRRSRQELYGVVYDEFFQRVSHQPQLAQRDDVVGRSELVRLQRTLLSPFLNEQTRFLEIGSGDCSLALSLAAELPEVVAVEASHEITADLDPPPNFRLVLAGDSAALAETLADESFDLAFSNHFAEHLHPEDLVDHLGAVNRVLRPGAPYVLVTPNRLLGPHDISKYFDDVARGFHLREYSHGELARVARKAGFERIRVMRGIGREPSLWPLPPYASIERCLGWLPGNLRRGLMARLPSDGQSPPFRAFEQVKLAVFKSER